METRFALLAELRELRAVVGLTFHVAGRLARLVVELAKIYVRPFLNELRSEADKGVLRWR
jgi:hypothetical protein